MPDSKPAAIQLLSELKLSKYNSIYSSLSTESNGVENTMLYPEEPFKNYANLFPIYIPNQLLETPTKKAERVFAKQAVGYMLLTTGNNEKFKTRTKTNQITKLFLVHFIA